MPTGKPVFALLGISSGVKCALEMDDLTEITATVQTAFGQELELIFGHTCSAGLLGPALHVWLLVSCAAGAADSPGRLLGRLGAGGVVHTKAPFGQLFGFFMYLPLR